MYQDHEDHGKQRRAIVALARQDEGLVGVRLIGTDLHLGEAGWPRIYPLGIREVHGVGAVLVVGIKQRTSHDSINLEQDFACVLLLRNATAEEAKKDGCVEGTHPEVLEVLRFISVTGGFFACTGEVSEAYVPSA